MHSKREICRRGMVRVQFLFMLVLAALVGFSANFFYPNVSNTTASAIIAVADRSTPAPEDTAEKNTDKKEENVSKAAQRCTYDGHFTDFLEGDHYIFKQLVQKIEGQNATCHVSGHPGDVASATVSISTGKKCKAYPGKGGSGATASCPTAVVSANSKEKGEVITICWHESKSGCGASTSDGGKDKSETGNKDTKEIEDELKDENQQEKNPSDGDNKINIADDAFGDEEEKGKYSEVRVVEDVEGNKTLGICTGAGECVDHVNGTLSADKTQLCSGGKCISVNELKSRISGGVTFDQLAEAGLVDYGDTGALGNNFEPGTLPEGISLPPTAVEQRNIDGFKKVFGEKNVAYKNGKIFIQNEVRDLSGNKQSVLLQQYPASTPPPKGYQSFDSQNGNDVFREIPTIDSAADRVNPAISKTPSRVGAGAKAKVDSHGGQKIKTGNPYRSFDQPKALAQKPRSFIQRFVGGNGGIADRLGDFVTGNNGAGQLRNTPQGDPRGGVQPQVVYVTPEFATPASINREFRSIQDIASDIALETQTTSLARVDHFAQTLDAVGGPSAVDTENKSFGRIQDLIVEDEAIRALRVAEEEGKRAKNSVFCRATETSESCKERREEKAQEVERKVFTEELEKRVLPQGAIQHFLAVYDGWVRPSPAPKTRATSTLGALHAQEIDPVAEYERTTDGNNFVVWIMDSIADATANAVSKLSNFITGGDKETATSTSKN